MSKNIYTYKCGWVSVHAFSIVVVTRPETMHGNEVADVSLRFLRDDAAIEPIPQSSVPSFHGFLQIL